MACFTVPLATAAAASAAKPLLSGRASRNPFAKRIGWLCTMMFGGSFLLAVEHIYHGEIIFTPPFLTAAKEGPEAISAMLHEMAVRGVAMTVLVFAAWTAMVVFSVVAGKKTEAARV